MRTIPKSIMLFIALSGYHQLANSQANTTLSNLVSPTKMNVNLLPDTTNSNNVGSNNKGWKNMYLTGSLYLDGVKFLGNSGDNTLVGATGNTMNTGSGNSFIGFNAGRSNSSASFNTATGHQTMYSNSIGDYNTAYGYEALYSLFWGSGNTASGFRALYYTVGHGNTATGNEALYLNTSGGENTASGGHVLYNNTTGNGNVVSGYQAGYFNTTGSTNSFLGYKAGYLNTTGFDNTCIGAFADLTSVSFSNSMALGYSAVVNSGNKIRFGNSAVTIIEGQVNYTVSDARFKSNIREEVIGLEFINKLRPVIYNFEAKKFDEFLLGSENKERLQNINYSDAEQIRFSGFIAQEVEQSANEVGYDFNGVHVPENANDNYSLAYAEFVVPLVKAVQELDLLNNLKSERIEILEGDLANVNINNKLQQKEIDELKTIVAKMQSLVTTSSSGELIIGITQSNSYLGQNIPNPFDNSTTIPFKISSDCISAEVRIVENSTGKFIKSIPLTCQQSQINIEAGTLGSGSYSYMLIVDGKAIDIKHMILAK